MNTLSQESLKKCYGSLPASVEERTRNTLSALPDRGRGTGTRRLSPAIALALVLSFLMIGTALAITLRYRLTDWFGLPESADRLVQIPDSVSTSAVTELASFTVESCLFDGISFMADVKVSPKRSDIWILPDWYDKLLDNLAVDLGINGTDLSIREYAASLGIRQIRYVQINDVTIGENAPHLWIQAYPYLDGDGLIHLLLTSSLLGNPRKEMDVTLRFYTLFSAQPREDTVTLHLTAKTAPESQYNPMTIEALGITIEQIDIVRTQALTYYRMSYTCSPEGDTEPRISPVFFDADGHQLNGLIWQGGSFDAAAGVGVILTALAAVPEEESIRFRLLVDGKYSDLMTAALQPFH